MFFYHLRQHFPQHGHITFKAFQSQKAFGKHCPDAIIGHIIHTDIRDTIDRVNSLSGVRVSNLSLAMGEAGLPSRILAGKFGAFGTFAAMDADSASAPGQPTLAEFKNLYRWDAIGPDTKVYGVVASPVSHSMSLLSHRSLSVPRRP